MMRKAGAGLVWFVLGLLILGEVWAEDHPAEQPTAASDPVAVQPGASSDATPRARVAARLEAVRDLSLADLKEMLVSTEAALPGLNRQLAEAGRAAQQTREQAASESPEVQKLYAQIRALHQQIAALTETLPAVQEKVAEETAIRSELLGEMDFRTKLTGLIRQKEKAEAASANAEELP